MLYFSGTYRSIRQAAAEYGLTHVTLGVYMKNPNIKFKGSRESSLFSVEEENILAKR